MSWHIPSMLPSGWSSACTISALRTSPHNRSISVMSLAKSALSKPKNAIKRSIASADRLWKIFHGHGLQYTRLLHTKIAEEPNGNEVNELKLEHEGTCKVVITRLITRASPSPNGIPGKGYNRRPLTPISMVHPMSQSNEEAARTLP